MNNIQNYIQLLSSRVHHENEGFNKKKNPSIQLWSKRDNSNSSNATAFFVGFKSDNGG